MILFKLALKEIRTNLRFSLFFIFNLSLGLSGLLAIDSLKISIRDALNSRAKSILTADIGVGSRRALSEEEQVILTGLIPAGSESTETFESFTMISSKTNSRLVEIKAIENNYPFYGEIELSRQGLVTSESNKDLFSSEKVWAYPELLLQLGLQVNDKIKIGDIEFTVSDIILRDSAGVGASFSFAPPLYISRSAFSKTGLIKTGSTGYYSRLYKLPKDINTEDFATLLNKKLTDPGIRISTSQNASEQVGRLLGYLGDYLGLAGLVALFLMALGQVFLYRSYLVRRYRDIAILKSLGLDSLRIFKLYLIHICLLASAALIPSLSLATFILPALKSPAKNLTNIDIDFSLHYSTIFLLLALAILGSILICGPLLLRATKVKPKNLLQSIDAISPMNISSLRFALYFSPAILAYYLTSLWLAQSIKTGSLFFILFSLSIFIIAISGELLLRILQILNPKNLALRLSIRNIIRARFSTLAALLALGMGVLLSNLIPIMEDGIKSEIETPSGLNHPSFFLIDIQEDQLSSLTNLIKQNNAEIMQSSAMIRARLISVNNQSFEKNVQPDNIQTREEENENRFRNRGFNITYRDKLSPSERIISGKSFSESSTSKSKISLESRFADRLKIKIGDILAFDIQGITIDGEVVNLRKVRWTSFQPNFFIQFEEGILNDAPKTFLTTLGQMPIEKKTEIQNLIVKDFPNISILDVSRVIERLREIITQMGFALRVMAIFSMAVGFSVLFSIASQQIYSRRTEINLLKILGSNFSLIRLIFLYEFLIITLLASLMGTLLSFIIAYLLATQIFDSAFTLVFTEPFYIFCITAIFASFITLFVVDRVLKSSPRELIQSAS